MQGGVGGSYAGVSSSSHPGKPTPKIWVMTVSALVYSVSHQHVSRTVNETKE